MKIDRSKLKKGNFDVPAECKILIEKISSCKSNDELLTELKNVKSWVYGKCELLNWVDVLDILDDVLEACSKPVQISSSSSSSSPSLSWHLACNPHPHHGGQKDKELLLVVLHFSSLLIEHSFTRHLYNSMEHLTALLAASDMTIVLAVIDVLYVFSKRSNFITRLPVDKKQILISRLLHLAESWGGKENGFGLSACCQDLPMEYYPASATTLHFEYYDEVLDITSKKVGPGPHLQQIHLPQLDRRGEDAATIMMSIVCNSCLPKEKEMQLFTHIRLALSFSNYEKRLQCVQARLQALSTLIYSNAAQDHLSSLLYSGFIEELVDVLELDDQLHQITDIKATSLRTLTAVVHLEGNRKLSQITQATGTSLYHGFLPVLMRKCIQHMTDPDLESFPHSLTTALFSFLYHLASYESGGEALVSCGIMESLLKVVAWHGDDSQDHITFVTRAVRVVDLMTNLDMQTFQSYGAMNIFVNRLQHEVDICRREQPFVFRSTSVSESHQASESMGTTRQCFPQRAALLKSMLNFLKKTITDASFADASRHLMDGPLPYSLKHIISNAEYYGPSLFLLATELVTVYVFQEPSMLSSLQSNGLTDVMLQALLVKDVPATKEVLSALPNVFSALCLNTRGLNAFMACKPFDNLFKVLLSPDYLPAMRRRRSSDLPGDTATSLGSAVDELMRHQPSLRTDAIKGIIKLLVEVSNLGQDPDLICQKANVSINMSTSTATPAPATNSTNNAQQNNNSGNSSDDEDDEDDVASIHSSAGVGGGASTEGASNKSPTRENRSVPLVDYVLNVMKFVEAILSNNTTDDHCREFVHQEGLKPLLNILILPNLPVDFPSSASCLAVASVCKSILTLTRDPQVLRSTLELTENLLSCMTDLMYSLNNESPAESVLFKELISAILSDHQEPFRSKQATPLLHYLTSIHSCVAVFISICKVTQGDIRTITLNHWSSSLGMQVLSKLSMLYTSLVWESSMLIGLCGEYNTPPDGDVNTCNLNKLIHLIVQGQQGESEDASAAAAASSLSFSSSQPTSSLTQSHPLSSANNLPTCIPMETNQEKNASEQHGMSAMDTRTHILKPLLAITSKLGRSLTELFNLLARTCVGTPSRPRRTHHQTNAPSLLPSPSPIARTVSKQLSLLLNSGLLTFPAEGGTVWRLRLTFLICSIGFTSSMLFDDKKFPYHLMLQEFVSAGGIEALYQTFMWVLCDGGTLDEQTAMNTTKLSEGSSEFFDAWLTLMDRMLNPKNLIESPYSMPPKTTANYFDPLVYLAQIEKMGFDAITYLWNKELLNFHGHRICEAMLNIICYIVKTEAIIKNRMNRDKQVQPGVEGSASDQLNNASIGQDATDASNAGLLMDMGFSRAHATQALLRCDGLEQATEYCLFHPPPAQVLINCLSASEEDQMIRAIAMSLGEDVDEVCCCKSPSANKVPQKTATASTASSSAASDVNKNVLTKEIITDFTSNIMTGCLRLLDALPGCVYRVSDVLIILTERNGEAWTNAMFFNIISQIKTCCMYLVEKASPMSTGDQRSVKEWADQLSTDQQANQLAVRLHLLSLLFEGLKFSCVQSLEDPSLLDLLVKLLYYTQQCLSAAPQTTTPKWVASLLLMLDLYEKMSLATKKRATLEKLLVGYLLGGLHTWKWFDDRSGKWSNYGAGNNRTIDDAYWEGQTSVKFTAGRRRYMIQFNTMIQVNEETGNKRPIMLHVPQKQEIIGQAGTNISSEKTTTTAEVVKMDVTPSTASSSSSSSQKASQHQQPKIKEVIITGLSPDQVDCILRSCIGLIGCRADGDTLHACMRLVLRLTRDYTFSKLFVTLGGPKLLLLVDESSNFQGFLSLATLILRHAIEDEQTLKYAMEKIVRSSTLGAGSNACGVAMNSNGSKEMHYLLRVLGPAVCRDETLFKLVATNVLRINVPPIKRGCFVSYDDEARVLNPANPQLLKSLPVSSHASPPVLGELAKEVVFVLLQALANNRTITADQQQQQVGTLHNLFIHNLHPSNAEQSSTAAADVEQTQQQQQATQPQQQQTAAASKMSNKPLMSRSSIMRLLAELVRSYVGCALFIVNQSFKACEFGPVTEDCTVLSYILDHLIHRGGTEHHEDPHLPSLSRLLLTSIASSNHSPDAQNILANELKASLQRSLIMHECNEKHCRIQAITGLIAAIIEACPSTGSGGRFDQVRSQLFRPMNTMNNMVKIMVKKGLVNDLARVTHNLDLSSPNMAATVNAALKPLETLSRIVNQPHVAANNSAATQKSGRQVAALERNGRVNNVVGAEGSAAPRQENAEADIERDAMNNEGEMAGGRQDAFEDEGDLMNNDDSGEHNNTLDEGSSDDIVIICNNEDDDDQEDVWLTTMVMMTMVTTTIDGAVEIDIELTSSNDRDAQVVIQDMSENEDDDDEDDDWEGDMDDDDQDEQDDDDEDGDDDDDDDDVEDDEVIFEFYFVNIFNVADELGSLVYWSGLLFSSACMLPPAPSGVMVNHPLLARNQETSQHTTYALQDGAVTPRLHRSNRARQTYRYNPSTQTLHVQYARARHVNPPAILQRLLGATTDVMQLTNSLTTGGSTRLHLMSGDELRVITRVEDESILDSLFQDENNSIGLLSDIPAALTRWAEESKVLEGEVNMHETMLIAKVDIMHELEKFRDEEVKEQREKRMKDKWTNTSAPFTSNKTTSTTDAQKTGDVTQTPQQPQQQATISPSASSSNNTKMTSTHDDVAEADDREREQDLDTQQQQQQQHELIEQQQHELIEQQQQLYEQPQEEARDLTSSIFPLTGVVGGPTTAAAAPATIVTTSTTDTSTNNQLVTVSTTISTTFASTQSSSLSSFSYFTVDTMAALLPSTTVQQTSNSTTAISPGAGDNHFNNDESTTTSTSSNETVTSPAAANNIPPTEQMTTTASAAPPASTSEPVASTSSQPNMFEDIVLPEGVDPSFLAALPENIRHEVIMEQLRLQRIQLRAQQQQLEAQSLGVSEVSPEFLAALPPNIQEEVLAQQRVEQNRLSQNPETPMDPASFIQSLPSSLRQQVLADMDDSMVAILPADLAAEANVLRRELEDRHRILLQERLFNQGGVLSGILRHPGYSPRNITNASYTLRSLPMRSHWNWAGGGRGNNAAGGAGGTLTAAASNATKIRGKHLLDSEGISCLLVLLFVDDSRMNTTRLHRVVRNLCYHAPTRHWIIEALLSILAKTDEHVSQQLKLQNQLSIEHGDVHAQQQQSCQQPSKKIVCSFLAQDEISNTPSWLNIYLCAALGSQTNVFRLTRAPTSSACPSRKHSSKHAPPLTISLHPQAAPLICRHVLDILISLAKTFPTHFIPKSSNELQSDGHKPKSTTTANQTTSATSPPSLTSANNSVTTVKVDFWDSLIKLDSFLANRKGKSSLKDRTLSSSSSSSQHPSNQELSTHQNSSSPQVVSDRSCLGQLMTMLSHPIIRKSQLLTDRLLRLLRLISVAFCDASSVTQQASTTAPPPSSTAASLSTAAVPSLSSAVTTATTTSSSATPPLLAGSSSSAGPSSTAADRTTDATTDENMDTNSDDVQSVVMESELTLVVEVLTSKYCSEEGLEDATNLLLQLAKHNAPTRTIILKLLIQGVHLLGASVCQHIRSAILSLSDELSSLCASEMKEDDDVASSLASTSSNLKGVLQDRSVVIIISTKLKARGRELQLASMQQLTNKTSSQNFLLRLLKVIIHLREAIRNNKKAQQTTTSSTAATPAATTTSTAAHSSLPATTTTTSIATPASTSTLQQQAPPQSSATNSYSQSPMEVDNAETTTTPSLSLSTAATTAAVADADSDASSPSATSTLLGCLTEHIQLDDLWTALEDCLLLLAKMPDNYAVLVLQPAVEAFFLAHADNQLKRDTSSSRREDQLAHVAFSAPMSPNVQSDLINSVTSNNTSTTAANKCLRPEVQKFISFAETHRTVLNQILRQSTSPLSEGAFSVLVDYTKVLDFDIKRRYFRHELDRMDEGVRKEDLAVHVRRSHVFEDSFRELHRRTPEEWKNRFYIVFQGEEGQDAGGLLREWYIIISREIFNPMYALFCTSPGDRVTYTINASSHCNSNHLSYFKFVGRIIAKAIYDNKLLECYFTRSFYKHILGVLVKYTDMESEDYAFYKGLVFLMENDVEDLGYELTFSTEVIQEFGVTTIRDLKEDGRNIRVTEENKKEYVKLVCQMKMTGAIKQQLTSFLDGFYSIIPKRLISIFNEQELELLISGLPNIDIDDLKANTEIHKYQANALQISWFWRALKSFDQADRARFLQFVTGTSKVPLQGFAYLEGMNGTQKFQIHKDDRSTDRLPSAHTCFNQLDLPVYETYDKLRQMLLLAIHECSEGFGLA
ncbi:hypothetical protein HELRODRAFT_81131 [Helobdella robusta]|uniref:HECT-type E3 ubiquitin transferase n=1 Tax=Helobdella robusta TaxID=6412 RepID=T1G499_HELRO|nr:hypothetical protein HELRODRAFT_81131 [Helobdella robusta]ESO02925.1 hypothetical protein HELRODRAFT_81131 [Helobdella robusta]